MGGRSAIPTPALILGWAGVLPFAALSLMVATGWSPPLWRALHWPAPEALWLYGALILSFMGGAQWGAPTVRDARSWRPYLISVLPALWAFASAPAPVALRFAGLIAGFLALAAYDLWCARRGETPAWYGRLRAQLTAAVCVCLAAAHFGI